MSEHVDAGPPDAHPVELIVEDDLHRNRFTVGLRIILAIPHLIWWAIWSFITIVAAVITWAATLALGRPPAALHRYMCSYIRYRTHLSAYLMLAANPYPGFVGEEGSYTVDVRLPPPGPQARWKTALRLLLALPALLLAAMLGGGGFTPPLGAGLGRQGGGGIGGFLGSVAAFLGWFASLVRGRMPQGLRDASVYGVGYGAQVLAYLLFVTDRYPNSDPTALLVDVPRPPQHPVHLVGEAHDLRRSRVMVFFRLPLAIPHLVWWYLWGIVTEIVVILNWFVTLIAGTPYEPFHRFVSRYLRYSLHFGAFITLAANPFPGFVGNPGTYPLDLELPGPMRQNRWVTGFRIILAIPVVIVLYALEFGIFFAAVLSWFASLATGRAPWGIRNFSAYALRYWSQANAYMFLVTDRYPHASPLEGADEETAALADVAV